MGRKYEQLLIRSQAQEVVIEQLAYGEEIHYEDVIPGTRTVYESEPKPDASLMKHEESRMINIIGRWLTGFFPDKEFEVSTIGTLDGVKYRIRFNRGGLSDHDSRRFKDAIREQIAMYVSKDFDNVYHLEHAI